MSFSLTQTENVLEWYFGIGSPTRLTTFYISFHSADPGNDGSNELSAGNYARTQHDNWQSGGAGVAANTGTGASVVASSNIGTATHFGVWDALSAGNFIAGNSMPISRAWNTGTRLTWADSAFTLTLTGASTSDGALNDMIQWLMNIGTPTRPTSWWFSYHTADPGKTGLNEFTRPTGAYDRHNVTAFETATPDDGQIENTNPEESPESTDAWQPGGGVASHFGIWSAQIGPTYRLGGDMSPDQTVDAAGKKITFDSNQFASLLS